MIEVSEREEYKNKENYCDYPICFTSIRHLEPIKGSTGLMQTWRMKERMKTVSVALVLCLNVGVDPPDIVKISPCARLESWIDPLALSPQKALELVGANLQKQYERWQPRARYKQSLDPTTEDVKKLCMSLRRNAKEERVLFHYNGHGVPCPTANGEIWVFNRTYTQYIPLSIYDLQSFMGAPSIYVYDCSNAGIIVQSFNTFAEQHEREIEQNNVANSTAGGGGGGGVAGNATSNISTTSFKNCIQLAACGHDQILPMNPDLPADLFTSCLTTPIKIALKWYTLQNTAKLVPNISYDLIERIPGQLNDRRTMVGELNWIFTAITDTIAWNTLPRDLFHKLFRQDLLVASLFRNFLLADRILRSYDCVPISSPALPECYRHAMWSAWDLALDQALRQLPNILENGCSFQHSPFFEEQLTAFQVWLYQGSADRTPPEQLPIVLQVLLSQVHRLRALELLGRFLDLGPWAVNQALSVGIFPYVLKLLQSSAKELKPLLVFIWAKILAVDCTCQADLVRELGYKYFIDTLQDTTVSANVRTMSAFILACIVKNYPCGQLAALQGSLISICLEQLNDSPWRLRQWLAICLGLLWQNYDQARWYGVRNLAHEKLCLLLEYEIPEVRAAAAFALGTFISSVVQRSEHANNIDRSIAVNLSKRFAYEMSPLVRMEFLSALQWLVLLFENQFVMACYKDCKTTHQENSEKQMIRVSSLGSIASISNPFCISYGTPYIGIWHILNNLVRDPYPQVSRMAQELIAYIFEQANSNIVAREATINDHRFSASTSLPPSPNTRTNYLNGPNGPNVDSNSPPIRNKINEGIQPPKRRISQQNDNLNISPGFSAQSTSVLQESVVDLKNKDLVKTTFIDWAIEQFVKPSKHQTKIKIDKDSDLYLQKSEKFKKNENMRLECKNDYRRVMFSRYSQVWFARGLQKAQVVKLHPYDSKIAVALHTKVTLHDMNVNSSVTFTPEIVTVLSPKHAALATSNIVTSIEFINPQYNSMTLVGHENGSVRLWRTEEKSVKPTLVSAWIAMGALVQKHCLKAKHEHKLVTAWDQNAQTLIASGLAPVIKIWDVECELCTTEFSTNKLGCTKTLSVAPNGIVAAGYCQGTVCIYDKRIPSNYATILTLNDHTQQITAATLRDDCESIVTTCETGEVCLYDVRKKSQIQKWSGQPDSQAISVHTKADLIASASNNLSIWSLDGLCIDTIKCHEGFMGPRMNRPTCVDFHSFKVSLAVGFSDNTVSVFTINKTNGY